jgi:hypothetical protein
MDNTFETPQGRLLPTLVAFVFVLGLLYTLYLAFTQYGLKGTIEDLGAQKEKLTGQIEVLKDQQVAEIFVAQELKDKLELLAVRWSTVVTQFNQLTPVGVFLSSYGISSEGSIQVSGVGDDFDSVASIIAALTDSEDFTGAFVPSVTQGTTSDGQSVATFSLTAHTVTQ